ncbi:hypothetical protein N656DRAFT_711905 [Canariomyces notabilis]|uniref:Uncharacterized protein n=1 Tax=Canariomyces notabilis TaxID=2074819 RepID=A0AAN6TBM0_9PEZI|nr:hypothetical protein N656DRAFT_711905 [Canariomyces arenarius]
MVTWSAKVLILAGAPESAALDWASTELLSDFQGAIAWFLDSDAHHKLFSVIPSPHESAAWRSLSLDRASLPSSFPRQYTFDPHYPSSKFFTTAPVSFSSDVDGENSSVLSQFYEHSIAAYQDLPSSHLPPSSGGQTTSFMSDGTTSLLDGSGSQPEPLREPLALRGGDSITDLDNIPSAPYLIKILPQTVTCNIIVGIISISQPREVKTRWGATKHLVELLVGDETKAGFSITYWLPSDDHAESPLSDLRPRDVILVQNVALNVFTKKVYGSSLRKDLTRVYLLYRARLDTQDKAGYYSRLDLAAPDSAHPQLQKTRRVRDWVRNFVGHGGHDRSKADSKPRWDRPPADDTQVN